MASVPRIVVVTRPSEYEQLLARHGTRGQAEFFLRTRGHVLAPVEERHARLVAALEVVSRAIPLKWRRTQVPRADLSRFVFEPEDLILAVGQDGLVPNVAKYLSGQPVIGINPDPGTYDGVLVRHPAGATGALLDRFASQQLQVEERTMVEARLDDGQKLCALNELFIGHCSHQSARYRLRFGGALETQSSSGIIVSTGTGSTSWALSVRHGRQTDLRLPIATDRQLAFFVREAWPSKATAASLVEGLIAPPATLDVVSEMETGGVAFGDGIEDDRLELPWGSRLVVRVSDQVLRLAV